VIDSVLFDIGVKATEDVSGQMLMGEATTKIDWEKVAEKLRVWPDTVFPNSSQRYTLVLALLVPARM